MTMTMQDIRKHETKTEANNSAYSERQNKTAFDLSLRDRTDRATIIEKFIAEQIEKKTGHQANLTVHNHPWDITVDLDKPVRVEVKSALIKKSNWEKYGHQYFQFTNIKPKYFDYLFIVFVTPKGTIEKWAKSEDVKKLCKTKKRNCNGWAIQFGTDNIPDFFYDIEDFPYGD